MEVERLKETAQLILNLFQELPIQQKLDELSGLLTTLSKSPNSQRQNEALAKVTDFEKSASRINLSLWDDDQRRLLESLEPAGLFEQTGIDNLKTLISNAVSKVEDAHAARIVVDSARKLRKRSTQIVQVLNGLDMPDTSIEPSGEERVVKLKFAYSASIDTLDDLEDWSKKWRLIFSAFSQLTDEPAESPRISGIHRGSTSLILVGIATVLWAITSAGDKILGMCEKVTSVRKMLREIKKLDYENAFLEAAQTQEEKETEELIDTVTDELLEGHQAEPKMKAVLRPSIRVMLEFITGGGQVLLLREGASDEELSLIQSMEDQYKLLEPYSAGQQKLLPQTSSAVEESNGIESSNQSEDSSPEQMEGENNGEA